METHKLTHSEIELKCSECGAVFKCELYLKNHQKRVHKMVLPAEVDDEPSAKRRKIVKPASTTESATSASTSFHGLFDQTSFDSQMSEIMMSKASNVSE